MPFFFTTTTMATVAEIIEAASKAIGSYQASKQQAETVASKEVEAKADTAKTTKVVLVVTGVVILILAITFFSLRKK